MYVQFSALVDVAIVESDFFFFHMNAWEKWRAIYLFTYLSLFQFICATMQKQRQRNIARNINHHVWNKYDSFVILVYEERSSFLHNAHALAVYFMVIKFTYKCFTKWLKWCLSILSSYHLWIYTMDRLLVSGQLLSLAENNNTIKIILYAGRKIKCRRDN